jgi:carboxypeptidase Q
MAQRLILSLFVFCAIVSCVYYAVEYSSKAGTTFDGIEVARQRFTSDDQCQLNPDLVREIASYQPIVNRIVNATLNGVFKGRTWRTLARFVDKFGPRIAGSRNLEAAIDYMVSTLKRSHLENVHTEPVVVPHWVRGKEHVWMVTPRLEKLSMLGLGLSVGTPDKGIMARVLVVNSFEDLKQKADQVKPNNV